MVEFEYLIDHGTAKKGDVRRMPKSTAEALAKHKIGKVGKSLEVKNIKEDTKAGPITTK